MVRTKVFVGNLSFKTTDKDLAKEFEVAGKVATANIISRGSRSLGYGFVEMESEEEAKKSVELLNKKTIDGREINVEVARPREDRAPAPAGEGSSAPTGDATTGSPARRGRRGGNKRTGGASSPAGTTPAAGDATVAATATSAPKRTRAPRKKNTSTEPKTEGATTGDATSSPSAPKRTRAPRPPRSDVDRTPSTTTLFVANLPFTVDDAQLADLFKGLNIKAAHVVRKPNNTNKSKGFGFVEFNNQEEQQKALEAVNKKLVGGRELSVKVALAEIAKAESTNDATTPAAGLPAVPAPGVAATAESK
eukprot:TRINITY_DN216_c0_g1_i1.p1 TRINITY_DN216_c0_g1~~TRINITY_DN216_c0_g1_i1.p1  ORF type:complete len:307 (+),score=123.38 TRINITY_DN216_c0_g1_i1:113-1033(+)